MRAARLKFEHGDAALGEIEIVVSAAEAAKDDVTDN
jgi:hypothetical protein